MALRSTFESDWSVNLSPLSTIRVVLPFVWWNGRGKIGENISGSHTAALTIATMHSTSRNFCIILVVMLFTRIAAVFTYIVVYVLITINDPCWMN